MLKMDKDTAREYARSQATGELADEFFLYALARGADFVTEESVVIHPVEMPKGTVRIAILITDDTRIRQIEKTWDELIRWRELLVEWQGPRENSEEKFALSLRETISSKRDEGATYTLLAQESNKWIIDLLTEYAGWLNDSVEFRDYLLQAPVGKKKQSQRYSSSWLYDYLANPNHRRPSSLREAHLVLMFFRPRLSDQDRSDCLQDALDNIQKGKQPFPPNEPVRKVDVRERIDYWKEKQNGGGK